MGLVHEHTPDDRGRVSAGNPSLSSEKRRDITERQLTYLYQKACQKEYFDNEAAAKAADGNMDVTKAEERMGRPMYGWVIATKLRKLNPDLWFELAIADPTKMGCYVLKNDFRGGKKKDFIAGFEAELNPEHFISIVNDEGRVTGSIQGWRTLLAKLVRVGLVTEPDVNRTFGTPSGNSERWARFVQ